MATEAFASSAYTAPMEFEAGELVRAAAAGDEGAWRDLVERFARMVWFTARSVGLSPAAAADVSQTTWLRLAEHLGRIREPSRVGAWLAVTARREALRVSRIESRVLLVDPWTELATMSSGQEPDSELLAAERNATLQHALAGLSARCVELLRALVADPPMTYEEISENLEIPMGSIGPTRGRCLARLRDLLFAAQQGERDEVVTSRKGTR
jgi:RNA polymerase sigma factor (sigma-70 family)